MSEPGLRLCGLAIQPDKKQGLFGRTPLAIVVRDIKGQIGSDMTVGKRAAHGVAGAAVPNEALLSEAHVICAMQLVKELTGNIKRGPKGPARSSRGSA